MDKFENFINEAHVTVKRKYTETHPHKKMYDGAKVRNTIFKAVGNGELHEDEIKTILSKMGADDRWHQRHKYFFDVRESDKGKHYKLATKAKKIVLKYNKKLDISEDDLVKENYMSNILTYDEFLIESTQGWSTAKLVEDISKLTSGTEVLVNKEVYNKASEDDNVEIFHKDIDYLDVLKKKIKLT